ncbi:MAG: 50S ribosomal protein L3 [Candidatus Levybacteria bacterium GW2011_GWA2_37_36]|nr:MAG: 50S ribosomal protein L3 [Candidatus Levybacteria bacterium GW2011_GWA1_37_16]KKQ33634.1 MAG: 50S ribosomal protein L3 [Candidatus Levybacteria bacterium GW2011_GWA2_37_36]
MNSILAKKVEQGQKFLEDGKRIPVTKLNVNGNIVVAIKTQARDKYSAVQLGFDKRAKLAPKSNKSPFRFLREVRMADAEILPAVGDVVKASDVFKPGDVVNVTGISKGKGYAGGVKRYHFKGGPRTHGQSDRERAPGSIGSTTTPGRVYRGKRMAGRMGHEQVTVKNIRIVSVDDNFILVKGLVPGGRNTLLMLKKVKDVDNKFIPLYADKVEPAVASAFVKTTADKKALAGKEEKKEVKVKVKEENK